MFCLTLKKHLWNSYIWRWRCLFPFLWGNSDVQLMMGKLLLQSFITLRNASQYKTRRDQFEDTPCCSTDWCEETVVKLLQLNSMVMSGGIYQYDKVKITLFFSFTRETVHPYFYPPGIDVMVKSLIWEWSQIGCITFWQNIMKTNFILMCLAVYVCFKTAYSKTSIW